MQIENYQQYLEGRELVLNTNTLTTIFRFGVEEILRRHAKAEVDLFNSILPDANQIITAFLDDRKAHLLK